MQTDRRENISAHSIAMGSGASGLTDETIVSNLENEVAQLSPHLPMAERLNGGLIRLTGFVGFFNVNSTIEPDWLKGKMTLEEYRSAIACINSTITRSQGSFAPFDIIANLSQRETAKEEAGRNAMEELNQRRKSVRFVSQQGVKGMILYPTWNRHLTTKGQRGRRFAHLSRI